MRQGETFEIFTKPGAPMRFPDLAVDPQAGVVLVVAGQSSIGGRFVSPTGVPQGEPIVIDADPSAISPRIAYSPLGGQFLVTWIEEASASIRIREVGWSPSGVVLGATAEVNQSQEPKHTECAPSLRCSSVVPECLVTWAEPQSLGYSIKARRVDAHGSPLGDDIAVSSAPGWNLFPAVGYNAARDQYLVAYMSEPTEGYQIATVQRIATGTGELVGGPTALYDNQGLNNYPEIACDSGQDRCLVITWFAGAGGPDVAGRMVDGDGQPLGDRLQVAATADFEGGDGIGLAFEPLTQAWLAVFQGPTLPDDTHEMHAVEISADGSCSTKLAVTRSAATIDTMQSRAVALPGEQRWLVAASVDYLRIDGQLVATDSPAAIVDAGADAAAPAGGSGGGGVNDAGSDHAGGAPGPSPSAPTDGESSGCGCRTRASATGPFERLGVLAGLLLGVMARRRRRRARFAMARSSVHGDRTAWLAAARARA